MERVTSSGPDPSLTPSDCADYLGWELLSSPLEQLSLVHIIKSDHIILAKVLLALGSISDELQSLSVQARKDYFNPILFYGESGAPGQEQEQESQVWISRMLPLLKDLSDFGDHCSGVIQNVLGQLAALHDKGKEAKKLVHIGDSHFQVAIHVL